MPQCINVNQPNSESLRHFRIFLGAVRNQESVCAWLGRGGGKGRAPFDALKSRWPRLLKYSNMSFGFLLEAKVQQVFLADSESKKKEHSCMGASSLAGLSTSLCGILKYLLHLGAVPASSP